MTDRPPLARVATDLLTTETPGDVRPSPAARAGAIAAIEHALAERRRAARRRSLFAGGALVLAAAAALLFVVRARRTVSTPKLAIEGTTRVIHEGAPLSAASELSVGDRVVTSNGGTVVLATGTRLVLDGNSDVGVAGAGKHATFDVRTGSVRFEVAKLGHDDRFVVRTSDTEVEVRGTVFTVAVVPPEERCGATPTRVVVRVGIVVVRHDGAEQKLLAGDSWPRCESAGATAPTIASAPAPTPCATIAPKPLPATDLAAQNDTFAEAMAKKRGGDREGAMATFDRLLAKWPASPLAENAAAERMRLASGPRAVTYAKAYLARFPNGFAAKEARTIAGAPQ